MAVCRETGDVADVKDVFKGLKSVGKISFEDSRINDRQVVWHADEVGRKDVNDVKGVEGHSCRVLFRIDVIVSDMNDKVPIITIITKASEEKVYGYMSHASSLA